ncbi:anti-sigma factor RsbA family regulatory protein [Geodermatophilus sp. SYSU D00697]
MSAVRPTGDWDGSGFAHEAFAFGTDQEVVDRVVPFVLEGLSRGEPVLVVAGERVRTVLAGHLGPDVARLATFAPAETWWRGGHGTLHAYDRDLRALRASVPTWRLAAEPVWLASEDGREWSRFEAVANRCYTSMPYYSLCLHDRQRLSPDVLDAVARTHPLTWGAGAPVPAAAYEDPRHFIRSAQPAWREPPAGVLPVAVTAPQPARRLAAAAAAGWATRTDDVVLAVHELVTNALRVAAFASVSAWAEGDTLVVEVADAGPGLPDETLGYVPPDEDPAGARGMWLAWSVADDVAVASGSGGTAIRLFFRR